jgi:hypothetical protein
MLRGEDTDTFRKIVLDMNARIRAASPSASQETVLVVFYSGHADASGLHLGDSTLPFDELKTIMAGSAAGVRLLIVDACRSGGVTRVKGAEAAEEFEISITNRIQAEGLAIITSSAAGEDSYESEQLRASFFSHHLANALRGAADSDRDGRVTLGEAYRYTYTQTLSSSGRTLQLQHPTFHFELKGKGELVLTRLDNDRGRSGQLRIREPGFYLVIEEDEEGPVAAEVSVGKEGTTLVLPGGDYFVQKRGQRHYLEYEIELSPGQAMDLDTAPHRTVEYARLLRKGGGGRTVVHGMFVLGGARGEILPGHEVSPHLVVGTIFDLPWLSIGVRGRYTRGKAASGDGLTRFTHSEYALGATAQRYLDLPGVSLAIGLLAEVGYFTQDFESRGQAPDRASWSFGFGGLITVEIEILPEMALLVEGGPMTQVFRRGVTEAGVEVESEIASPFTWWVAGGLAWRF